jgi:hypothetical protein
MPLTSSSQLLAESWISVLLGARRNSRSCFNHQG